MEGLMAENNVALFIIIMIISYGFYGIIKRLNIIIKKLKKEDDGE